MKTKKDLEIEELSKQTELKDSWRYFPVGNDTWKLEGISKNPEDQIIERLDLKKEILEVEEKSGIDYLQDLDLIHSRVVFYYLWEGISFQKIGKIFGFTKQRAHQIYHEAILQLKEQNECQ
jgi:DNA-directed RNA polymerase sigma subunit (sigma70/sigma32)